MWSRPFFRVLTVWSALTNLMVNALFFVAVLRLIEGGFDALHIGLVEAAAGLAGIVGAVLAPWVIERAATGWLTIAIAWSFLPLVVPMALWNQPLVVAAALGLGLLLNPAGNAGIGAYRIAVTPPELIGRVQSTTQFVSMCAMPLAPILAGVLLATLGGGPGDPGARRPDRRRRADPDAVPLGPRGPEARAVGPLRGAGAGRGLSRPDRVRVCQADRPAPACPARTGRTGPPRRPPAPAAPAGRRP